MPAVTIAIRDLTGNVTPAANAADVLAAIKMGEDIVVNGQTAIISNIGGPSGTWLVNAKPIGSFFMPATGPDGTGTPTGTGTHTGTGTPTGTGLTFTPAPNGVTQYYDSNMHLWVWNPYQAVYVDQGGSDTFGLVGFGVLAVLAYFLFIRK